MDILIIYQYCGFAGVERAILNRALSFRKYHEDVRISVGYLHDTGALKSYQAYISAHQLEDYISVFLLTDRSLRNFDRYDYVFNIDTPQILESTRRVRNMVIECHTPYIENRQYLRTLPNNIRKIIVPSHSFKTLLLREFPNLPPIFVLPNPVSEGFYTIPLLATDTIYAKRPVAFIARLDELKNFSEAARIFQLFATDEKVMFAVVGRGAKETHLIKNLQNRKILGKTFLRDSIDFDTVPAFIGMIRHHQGIFISPSKGESFGLSAAEFISAGVPVLLSDIAPHRELVEDDERFLYPLGDLVLAKRRITNLLEGWQHYSKIMESYGEKFKGDAFISAWRVIVDSQIQL